MVFAAVELLADIVLRNSLNDTEVDRARSVVLHELQVSVLTFIYCGGVHVLPSVLCCNFENCRKINRFIALNLSCLKLLEHLVASNNHSLDDASQPLILSAG